MITMKPSFITTLLIFVCGFAENALAQTSPLIVLTPWNEKPHWADTTDEITFHEGSRTKGSDLNADIWTWYSSGRIKFDRDEKEPRLVLGYQLDTVSVDSALPAIHGDYWDVALALAYRMALDADWQLVVTGGIGTANDSHFSNSHAIYGTGHVHAARRLDEHSTLHLGIRYDGNAMVLRHIPFPYVAWQRQWNDQLDTVLGLPLSQVFWRPMERLAFTASYMAPVNLTGRVDVGLIPGIGLFAAYQTKTLAFYVDGTKDDRMFYETRQAQGGLRFVLKWAEIETGVGYSFRRDFTRGDTIDSTRTVAKISDAPFMFVAVKGTF